LEKKGPWGIRWTDEKGGFTPGFPTKETAEKVIKESRRPGKVKKVKTYQAEQASLKNSRS